MDEKTIIEIFGRMLDERDNRLNERLKCLEDKMVSLDSKIDMQTEDLKKFIVKNNVAISEVITTSLEDTLEHVKQVEQVTKNNLYDITVLKEELKQG